MDRYIRLARSQHLDRNAHSKAPTPSRLSYRYIRALGRFEPFQLSAASRLPAVMIHLSTFFDVSLA